MKSFGVRSLGIYMYSHSAMSDIRYIFLMSIHIYLALGSEMVLLRWSFTVEISAVGALTSCG